MVAIDLHKQQVWDTCPIVMQQILPAFLLELEIIECYFPLNRFLDWYCESFLTISVSVL